MSFQARSNKLTSISGTIASGGVSQLLVAAKQRKYLIIINPAAASGAVLWVRPGSSDAAASQPSIPIDPRGSFVMESIYVSCDAWQIFSTTGGAEYTAYEGLV